MIPPAAKVYAAAPTPEDAAVLFELAGAVASPGSKGIPVDLHVTSSLEFSGFGVSLKYPAKDLVLTRVEEHTRPGIVHIDNDSGHLGIFMANSRRRVGAEGERVRIATLHFDLEEGAQNEGELVSSFEAKHPYTNWLVIQHEPGSVNELPVAANVEPIHVVDGLVRIQSRPTGPGDVNLDYALDLSDAIALLSDLFQGGSRGRGVYFRASPER